MRFCSFIFLALMTAELEVSSFETPRFHPTTKRITATQLSATNKKTTNVGRALMNGGGVRPGDSDHESRPYGTSGRGSYATNLKADAADHQNRPEPVYYAETAAAAEEEETPAVVVAEETPAVAEPEAPVAGVAPVPEPPAPVADADPVPVPAPPVTTTTANRVALTNGGTQGSVLLPGQFETVDHTAPYGKMSDYGSVAERNPRSKPLTATTLPKVMVPASDDALQQQQQQVRTRTRNNPRTPNYAPTTQGLVPLHYDGQETQQITSTATTTKAAVVAAAAPTAEQFFPDKMDSSTDSTSHKNTATTATGQQLRRSTMDPFLPDTVKVKASHASGKARLTNVGKETFQSGGTDIPLVASSDRFVPQPKQPKTTRQQQLQPTASANNMPYDTTTFNHQMSIQITPTKE